jgi:two-component system response regulator
MSEILLIEGSATDAGETEALLRTLEIKNPLRHLSDGAAAMNLLRALADDPNGLPPGIILLDVTLPAGSGFEILRWMRDQKAFKHTLKIVLSTLDDTATIKEAYHLGANSFLNKPVRLDDLRELIETYPQHWLINGSGQQALHTG